MLKKTGIVVATEAGLLALTPLAFAGESHGDWHKDHGSHKVEKKSDFDYDYDVDNSIDREQYNECAFGQSQDVAQSVLGALPLVAPVPPVPAPAGPVAQTQDQTGNCTNVGDTL